MGCSDVPHVLYCYTTSEDRYKNFHFRFQESEVKANILSIISTGLFTSVYNFHFCDWWNKSNPAVLDFQNSDVTLQLQDEFEENHFWKVLKNGER